MVYSMVCVPTDHQQEFRSVRHRPIENAQRAQSGMRYYLLGGKLGVLCGKINNKLTK
ncbi:hypothetical protein SRABI27_01256 [Pedobacter sp. Bi27]|nr:hypothetical protein SRABI27_01256 [Pedobacter sp. Bi27]